MNLAKLDQKLARYMFQYGFMAVRFSFAIIFFWFGILKPFGLSAAEPLVLSTAQYVPIFSPKVWLIVIGWSEVAIGLSFLSKKTIRIGLGMMAFHMIGTFLPLVLLPEITFQEAGFFYLPTLEGQYIIKNLMLISAGWVIGGTVYSADKEAQLKPEVSYKQKPFTKV